VLGCGALCPYGLGFLYQQFSSLLGNEACLFRNQQSSTWSNLATIVLFGTRGPSLFLVIREGLGIRRPEIEIRAESDDDSKTDQRAAQYEIVSERDPRTPGSHQRKSCEYRRSVSLPLHARMIHRGMIRCGVLARCRNATEQLQAAGVSAW
jgi:hypothetical protein